MYPHPSTGWSFVVVCDEESWKHLMQRTFLDKKLGEHYGETDIDKGITLIRGYKLLNPDAGASPEHIIAHELAHIMLHSRDEKKVDRQAEMWVAQQGRTTFGNGMPPKKNLLP